MKNKDGKIGNLLLIMIILTIITVIVLALWFFIRTDDVKDVYKKDNNYETKDNNENDNREKSKISKGKYSSFIKTIKSLDYSRINDDINTDFALIYDYYKEKKYLVSTKDGKILLQSDEESFDEFKWYGNFGVLTSSTDEEEYTYIIDKNGELLFKANSEYTCNFYKDASIWKDCIDYGGYLDKEGNYFYSEGTEMIDSLGNYFYEVTDKLKIIDLNQKLIYEKELPEEEAEVFIETSQLHKDETYGTITFRYGNDGEKVKSAIINLKTGNIVYSYVNKEINCVEKNLFEIGDKTIFIYNDKIALTINEKVENYHLSDKYVEINNDLYELSTMRKTDENINIPDDEELEMLEKYNIELTSCRMGEGLKYNNKELIPCKDNSIIFFSEPLNSKLINSNRLYVSVNTNDELFLYDVKNDKKIKELIDGSAERFVNIYENEDIYIYDVLKDKAHRNPTGDILRDSYINYYVLTDDGNTYYEYYNENFEKFYEIKK